MSKYINRNCDKQEQDELFRMLNVLDRQELDEILSDIWLEYESDQELDEKDAQQMLNSIISTRPRFSMKQISIAASLLIGVLFGSWLLYTVKKSNDRDKIVSADIRPGGNKAELTLANGKKVLLGSGVQTINLPNTDQVIRQSVNGTLIYGKSSAHTTAGAAYDTLRTPKGGVYQLNLTDGTKVWLNTSSAIRFPENFAHNKRDVELLYGEAYFEVKHRSDAPFTVKTVAGIVRDLGTHFNVNSKVTGGRVAATLLEGAIEVETNGQVKKIKPGQQALFNQKTLSVNEVDTEEMVAWKEGYFMFDESLESAMQEISQWYDVKVEYQDEAVKGIPVLATITRSGNIRNVLRILEMTKKVTFKIEGRTIKVFRFK